MRFPFPASRHAVLFSLFVVCLIVVISGQSTVAQTPVAPENRPPIVSEVSFKGNELFSSEILALQVRTRANRRFLGIPGVTWWTWLYKLGASGKVGKRFGQALMAGGEAPAFLDSTLLVSDVERLRTFYLQEGFRSVQVAARVDSLDRGKKVNVTFLIQPGKATYVRYVSYSGIEQLPDAQKKELVEAALVPHSGVEVDTVPRYRAQSFRYSEPVLLEERRRILSYLWNEGYARVTRDSIRAFIFPQARDTFDINFRIHPGPRYRFGKNVVRVAGPEDDAPIRTGLLPGDETRQSTYTFQAESKLNTSLIERSLRFDPGDWYDQSRLLATKRRMDATGIFAFTDISPLWSDTTHNGAGEPVLPHRFDLRTRRRHGVRFETFMLQRSSVLGSSDSELGAGVGVSYENANLFGGGESFEIRTAGSLSGNIVNDTSLAAQAEVSTSLSFPYLIRPFHSLDRVFNLYDAHTRISLSALTARRDEVKLIIRGRGIARLRLEMYHTATVASLLDVLDVSLSNPDTLNGFKRSFLDRIFGDGQNIDPVQQAQILEDYTQPQVNSAFRYTFRSANANPLRRDRGYSYESSVEVGSNLPYLLDRFVFSPDTLEGSLPGLPLFRGDRRENRLIYRQYLRLIGEARRYVPLSNRAVFAYKISGGFAQPTGRADVVPFDRRFYSGGPNSVRGWGLRELGPGASSLYSDTLSSSGSTSNLIGGDVKLESSIEYRYTALSNLLAADWLGVAFIDAGNVWIGPRNPTGNLDGPNGRFKFDTFYKEIAVATGAGLRISWEYLILRLDLGFKAYDPARTGKGLFPDRFSKPQVHFGIGHAF